MSKSITKVKKKARGLQEISVENTPGWRSVLTDLNCEIERLRALVPIVERKIKRGEPWPTEQSATQN